MKTAKKPEDGRLRRGTDWNGGITRNGRRSKGIAVSKGAMRALVERCGGGLVATAVMCGTAYGGNLVNQPAVNPVAQAEATPDPVAIIAATGVAEVQLDGSASYHPDPLRSIASYAWALDDDGTVEVTSNDPIVQMVVTFSPMPPFLTQRPIRLRVAGLGHRFGQASHPPPVC